MQLLPNAQIAMLNEAKDERNYCSQAATARQARVIRNWTTGTQALRGYLGQLCTDKLPAVADTDEVLAAMVERVVDKDADLEAAA